MIINVHKHKTLTDFYHLVGIPSCANLSKDRKLRMLMLRVSLLGEGQLCGSCMGNSQQCFNRALPIYCYTCNGLGIDIMDKSEFDDLMYKRLEEKVRAGHLDEYHKQREANEKRVFEILGY